jgi:hypothetical protein
MFFHGNISTTESKEITIDSCILKRKDSNKLLQNLQTQEQKQQQIV